MNWFTGPIEQAILQSKKEQLIFMVHVYDPNSLEMDELWNDEQVNSICSKELVSLRIDSTTEAFKQFNEYYKVLCLPSTFFIGDNGVPIEIIAGLVSLDDLLEKINKIVKQHHDSKEKVVKVDSASNEATSSTSENSKKSLEEKVAEAKRKIKQLQDAKFEEEKEKERKIEMERRKLGQEILRQKQLKDEQDLKRLAEEKKKEKLNEELAKKRVLEQIERDREEKKKKYEKEKQEAKDAELKKKLELEQEKQAALATAAAQNSLQSKIQFRLIDGSNIVQKFESTQKLSEIREFLVQKLRELDYSQSFAMHTMHPKRVLGIDEMSQSLKDLELAPTATILVIPTQTNSVQNSIQSNGFLSVFSTVASLFFIPFSYVWSFVSGYLRNRNSTPSRKPPPSEATLPKVAKSDDASDIRLNRSRLLDSQNSNSENLRKRETFKKEGNIARLSADNDDSDETNTWNGNSTQQM